MTTPAERKRAQRARDVAEGLCLQRYAGCTDVATRGTVCEPCYQHNRELRQQQRERARTTPSDFSAD